MRKRVKDCFQCLELGKVPPTSNSETRWEDGELASAGTDRQKESVGAACGMG